jgi:ABC-type glutathione transport system ATPase component
VLNRYPGELSGGMGQRVMIALALLNNPQVLIADEPTSALDARLRNQILELLVEQCEQRRMAMLLISHDLPLVAEHCQRVLVLYQGEKVDEMAARDLPRRRILHPYALDLSPGRANLRSDAADPRPNPELDGGGAWRSLISRIYRLFLAKKPRCPPPALPLTRGNVQPDRRIRLRKINDSPGISRAAAGLARPR